MNMRMLAVCALVLLPGAVSAGPAVTIYSHDLGYVRETRSLDLRGGSDTVRIEGVSNRLDVSSVRLVPASGRVLRLAYRWDVASGDELLARGVGQRLRVISKGERVAEGTLLSADGSWLVLRADDGSLSALAREQVQEVRIARPDAALSLKPAVEAVIEGAKRGTTNAELQYLTGGLSWTAEHTLVRTGETSALWSSFVQIENTTGRPYDQADVKLVAGEPSRVTPPRPKLEMMQQRTMVSDGAAPQMSEEAFADYHLYTLDGVVTLRDREAQTLVMYAPKAIAVKPRYVFRSLEGRGVLSQLEFVNSAKDGPGVPLPAGRVRGFAPDGDKDLQFTGEANVGHTPVDEKVTLDLGLAFDIKAERKEMASRRISDKEREYDVDISLRNRKNVGVTIVVEEAVGGDVEILKSSLPSTRKDANTLQFTVPVPAGKEVHLTFTARQRW